MNRIVNAHVARLLTQTAILTLPVALSPVPAGAACNTVLPTTTCNTAAPNPWTTRVGEGNVAAGDNRIVDVLSGSQISVGNDNAISLRDAANITIRSGATVRNAATNANGQYGTGGNTIEIRNNGTLTIEQGGQLLATGTQAQAEAVNFQGAGNTIVNSGTIDANNAVAIWSQNISGLNTVTNTETGVIEAGNGTTSTVIGGSGNGALDFTNRGTVRGSINLAGGNDILRLFTGSTVTGNFSGGAGTDQIFLSGSGQSSLPGNFVGFESLTKNGLGTWDLTGTITGVTVSTVQQGTLILTGTNTNYTGQVIVDPAGTLQARAQSLPPTVTNNGLVRFAQPDTGTYSGLISGTGAVEKTGAGVVTLAPTAPGGNTYSGGTRINEGVVAAGADSALGAATGGITFNGGVLRFNSSFDLAATRAVVINAQGGTIDTQGFNTTLAQGATGAGGLTKQGSGVLTLTGANTYAGGTTISGGTVELGDGGTSGSIVGDVANNGALVFNRSDISTFSGIVSGTGTVTQAGTGTTVLTGDNTYTGGTTISAGTLQLGDGGTSGAIVGDVANDGALVFNRSDTVNFAGVISGAGSVSQIGSGSTILNADNPYTGGTTVSAGSLAIGDAAHPGAALSGGGPVNILPAGTLGGYGSVTGAVANQGTIAVADALAALAGGPTGNFTINGSLANAGLAQVGGAAVGNTLTVAGDYIGQNGGIGLNTFLGTDGSPSDKLIVDGGSATGTTGLSITNLGGPGAQTLQDGIMVIEALNGGTTANGAFALTNFVAAGAFEYYLFKGGAAGGTSENWYLRNTIVAPLSIPASSPSPLAPLPPPPEPTPENPNPPAPIPTNVFPFPVPTPADPTLPRPVQPAPPTPGATPFIGPVIPLYRPEVPTYAVVPPIAREATMAMLGTFHERRGEQSVLTAGENFSAAWGRVFGQSIERNWAGTVAPSVDGSLYGIQAGLDILRREGDGGHRDIAGVFIGQTGLTGDVNGFALGWNNLAVGEIDLDATSVGAYWTHVGPNGWYVDAVLMGSFFSGESASRRGIGVDIDGTGVTASLEGGYPIPVVEGWILEPQAQLIWQHLSLDDQDDGFSTVAFDTEAAWTGRVGLRLQGDFQTPVGLLQPYLKANLWHAFSATDDIVFGTNPIGTEIGGTALELGGGVVAAVSENVRLFATADYTFDVDGEEQRAFEGNVGLSVKW